MDNISLAKVLRTLKAFKILRLTRLVSNEVADAIDEMLISNAGARFFVKMSKLALTMGFILHWMACVWHYVAPPEPAEEHTDSWIHKYFMSTVQYGDGIVCERYHCLTPLDDINKIPFWDRYLGSVYWSATTMSTVGYGDITPSNNQERAVTTVCLMIGGALYGLLVGSMVSMVSDVDAHTKVYLERMGEQVWACACVSILDPVSPTHSPTCSHTHTFRGNSVLHAPTKIS